MSCRVSPRIQDFREQCHAALAGRIATGMMVMGYLSAIVRDKEGAADHKAGGVGGGYHSACLTAYGALTTIPYDTDSGFWAGLRLALRWRL